MGIDNLFQDLLQTLFAYVEIHFQLQFIARDRTIHKAQVLRQNLVEDKPAHGGLDNIGNLASVCQRLGYTHLNAGLQLDGAVFISQNCFVYTLECLAFSNAARTLLGQIIDTQNHILRRNSHRTSVRRFQQVIR